MRFGFKTSPQDTTWADMLAVWKAADEIDFFESGWTFDHFYPIFGDSTGPCMEGWTVTTALAQATTRLRFGLLVTGMHYRHPAVLANMAAALDIISDGRLEVGIGAGWNEEESGAYGIELGSLKDRSDRFEEGCEVIDSLLRNEVTNFEGRFYTLRNARNEPKPVQQPRPPICIGGGGEKRTLKTAARFADHWNMAGGSVDDFKRKRDILGQHCESIGRDPSEIMTSTHLRLPPTGDASQLVPQAEAFADAGIDLGIVYLPPPHTPEVLEPIAKALSDLAT